MPARMNLGLRNWLAERCLEEISGRAPEGEIAALARFAERADRSGVASALAAADVDTLGRSTKIFERAGDEVRLLPNLLADLPELRWRTARFVVATTACRACCGPPPPGAGHRQKQPAGGMPPSADELAWTLCAAAELFNAGLFFEVHELLEPCWIRAEGPLRLFLQGLIQIAAGLHHEQNGNRRGAIALLGEGAGKLRPFAPHAHGIDLGSFLKDIGELARSLAAASAPVELRVPPLVVRTEDD